MSEENIFQADQPTEIVVESPAPVQDALPPEVAELVGEGKKYKTTADALKALPHAQAHILKIEADNAALKEEVTKRAAMEELLNEFKQQGLSTREAVPQAQDNRSQPVDINSAVEAALARKEAQLIAKANADQVIGAFKGAFGDDGEAQFVKLAQENGLSVQYLNNLAQTSPNAVLKLAGLKKGDTPSVPHSQSSVNTESNFSSNQDISAKVKMVGSSTKDVMNAWKNAGIKAERLRNS